MKTNVLVIGGGGAGLTAAISAAKEGARVRLVSKTRAGLNTCTAYSGGIFSLACGEVTPEEHFAKTMEVGCHANDAALVQTMTEHAEQTLLELQRWGVDIRFPRPGKASVRQSAAHKLMGGEGFTAQLQQIAQSEQVELIESSIVTDLLNDDSGVCGAKLVNWQTGKAQLLYADAVIIATGGAGQIFSRNDNPVRMTGDGYALALKAGLKLRDMEFIQFYPLGWNDPQLPVWMADLGLIDFIPLTDSHGKEFLLEKLHEWGLKNGSEGNLYARDRAAAAIAQAERSGGAFLHLEAASSELWQDRRFLRQLIIDPARLRDIRRPVRVAPLEHYFCGGIAIDAESRTAMPRLYACGEATGGVDGANRMGGNALANIVTFGMRAGKNAAAESPRVNVPVERETPLSDYNSKGELPSTLRRQLQKTMWDNLGPIRYEKGLREALEFLDEFEARPMQADSPLELLKALEMPGLIQTARASAKAALLRKVSLGVHFREDSVH